MTKGVKITGIIIGSAIAGVLLVTFYYYIVSEGYVFAAWTNGVPIGGISGAIFGMIIILTRRIIRDRSKLIRRIGLSLAIIVGLPLSVIIGYFLGGLILGLWYEVILKRWG